LLAREPTDRTTGSQLLPRLGSAATDRMASALISISRDGGFAGRTEELAMLDAALEPLAVKRASVALVRAPSGMGKTSLVNRFLERLRATRPNALIPHGRRPDRRDVPYHATDPLV